MNHRIKSSTSAVEEQLRALLLERILILDGAMGTMIQRYKLTEEQYRGDRFADHPSDVKGNNELLVLTQPQVIREIHEAYLAAGADLLETNTFGATAIALGDYGLPHLAYEINLEAARIAKAACDQVQYCAKAPVCRRRAGTAAENCVDLAGCQRSGRTQRQLRRVASHLSRADSRFDRRRRGYLAGRDHLRHLNAKAALFAIDEVMEDRAAAGLPSLPIMISGTVTDASGPDSVGPNGRGLLEFDPPCAAADGWA